MCVLIDANVWSAVFDEKNEKHHKYSDLLFWLNSNKEAMIVYGGKTYKKELLSNGQKRLQLLDRFNKSGKVRKLNDAEVDEEEQRISEIYVRKGRNPKAKKDFDDKHLLAIMMVGKTRLLCSEDKDSKHYLNDKEFYPEKKTASIKYYRYKITVRY